MTSQPTRCRSCFEPIRWERTAAGKLAPIALATGQNHFLDCPQRRQWRREPAPSVAPRVDQQPSLFDDEHEGMEPF